jgi:hypothetical protein
LLIARLRQEGGFAVLTAILLMTIMVSSSLVVVAYVDTETKQSKVGRNRETSFNLSEAALNAQLYALSLDWPGFGRSVPGERFDPCLPATGGKHCPDNGRLMALFPSADTAAGATWKTEVRDNRVPEGPTFYSDAFTAGQPGYDANKDGMLWVRAESTVRAKQRILVALVRAETQFEDIPHAGVITGGLTFANKGSNGDKQFIDTGTSTLGVQTRCNPTTNPDATCEGLAINDPSVKNKAGKWDNAVQTGIQPYTYSPDYPNLQTVSTESLQRLIATAKSNGTYFTSCPSDLSGAVVVLDMHGTCSKTGSPTYNAPPAPPGMLILLNSDSILSFGGGVHFYGVIYHANLPLPGSTADLIQISGNSRIDGGVIMDGQGRLDMQGSSFLAFNENGFGAVKSIGSAGIVQNTWRELMSR